MFINPKDAPFAVAMAALLYALVRAIEEYPRPSAATIAIFGISLGLTLGTRIMGGMAALYVILPLALLIAHDWRHHDARSALKDFGRFVLWLVPGLIICLRNHGFGLALVGAGTAQSVPRGGLFLALLREAMEGDV